MNWHNMFSYKYLYADLFIIFYLFPLYLSTLGMSIKKIEDRNRRVKLFSSKYTFMITIAICFLPILNIIIAVAMIINVLKSGNKKGGNLMGDGNDKTFIAIIMDTDGLEAGVDRVKVDTLKNANGEILEAGQHVMLIDDTNNEPVKIKEIIVESKTVIFSQPIKNKYKVRAVVARNLGKKKD